MLEASLTLIANDNFLLYGGIIAGGINLAGTWILEACDCNYGTCTLTGTPSCECQNSFTGPSCNISSSQNLNVTNSNQSIVSNNNNETVLNNANVVFSTLFITGPIHIYGNMNLDNSIVELISSNMNIDGNFSSTNTSMSFSNSSIVVGGCANLKTTSILVDLSKYSVANNIVLLKSLSSCLLQDGSTSLKYSNVPQCNTVSHSFTPDSLLLLFNKNTQCEKSNGFYFDLSPLFYLIQIFILII